MNAHIAFNISIATNLITHIADVDALAHVNAVITILTRANQLSSAKTTTTTTSGISNTIFVSSTTTASISTKTTLA